MASRPLILSLLLTVLIAAHPQFLGRGAHGPYAAPDAPLIEIRLPAGTDDVVLRWDHVMGSTAYEVWRSTGPYFDPAIGEGNRVADLFAGHLGAGSTVEIIEDGVDRYAGDGSLAPVQVVGDATVNYFWLVRSRNTGGEISEPSNRVGAWDFALAPGG